MATVPAPRRLGGLGIPSLRPAPRRDTETRDVGQRPSLRVVDRRRRAPRYGLWTAMAIFGVFGVLLAVVMFHTVLLQNQRRLDQLDTQVRDEQALYQQLRLEVAQLSAPQRIIDAATTKLGLVPSQSTIYLTPSGADAVAARQAEAAKTTDPSAAGNGDDPAVQSGWPQVKPYLGSTP
jgi:cell division protein FtsL